MDSVLRTLATISIDFPNCVDEDLAISKALHESLNWRAAVNQTLPYSRETERSVLSAHIQQPAITPVLALKSLLFQISNKKVQTGHALLARNMMRLIHALCREIPKAFGYVMRSMDSTSAAIKEIFFTIAARFGQSALIANFLATGTDPNALIDHTLNFNMKLHRGKTGLIRNYSRLSQVTPLQLAAAACDIEMAVTLLQFGARPNLGYPTPLQIVCSLRPHFNSVRFAQTLLRHGASLNTNRGTVLFPPLLEAVAAGNVAMVQYLLSEGVSNVVVRIPPLQIHVIPGQFAILPLQTSLVSSDGRRPPEGDGNVFNRNITALQLGILINDRSIVEMLVSALRGHGDRENMYRLALMTACLADDDDMVCRSLDAITDIRHDKPWIDAALCVAAWIPDCRITRRLLKLAAISEGQESWSMSPMLAAIQYNNVTLVKLLHCYGYDINGPRHITVSVPDGLRNNWKKAEEACLSLEFAIRTGHSQTVRILLQLGARVPANLIAIAIAHGTDDMVFDLLARGANVDQIPDGPRLLETALGKRKGLALIRKLVDAGAEISGTALVTAIGNDDKAVSGFLLNSGVDLLAPSITGTTVLEAATRAGNMEIVKRYFDYGGHYSSRALLLAVDTATWISHHSIFEYLCQRRPVGPMDVYENTILVRSILKDDRNLVELFLSYNIGSAMSHYCWHWWESELCFSTAEFQFIKSSVRGSGSCNSRLCFDKITPLWAAAHMQQKPLVEHFISGNHPPDAFLLESALYHSQFSNSEIRQQLIKAYPPSSIRDKGQRRRLLMVAIRENAGPELFRQHINSLSSLNFVFSESLDDHWTPLQFAAKHGNIEHARLLLDAQANIDEPAACQYGGTALQVAVDQENFELTIMLLERGADINAPGFMEGGCTALQLAVSGGNLKMAMLLLDHGADANAPPAVSGGRTAIEIAAELGFIDMVALLLPHICFQGHARLHLVRAAVYSSQNCHYAIANLLKQGRWTEEDLELSITPQATEIYHTCPRMLYNEQSWEGKCPLCDKSLDLWPDSSSSEEEEENTTHSLDGLTEVERQVSDAGVILADDLVFSEDQSNILDIDQALQATGWSFGPYDTSTRWLDDLVKEYFEDMDVVRPED